MAKKVLFIHHSIGANLIQDGHLRKHLRGLKPELEFWDHNYNLANIFPRLWAKLSNKKGLTGPQGQYLGEDYDLTISNNSPKEFAEIFSRPKSDPTLAAILTYDLIAFKNCYPTTIINSDSQLALDQKYYLEIKQSISEYQDKKFILITPPPARRERTNHENSARAKELVNWLLSKDYNSSQSNIFIFDLFGLLADESGMLKKEYTRFNPFDSHPNRLASEQIAPLFVHFLAKIESLNGRS